jgi:hypothetical protein
MPVKKNRSVTFVLHSEFPDFKILYPMGLHLHPGISVC